MSSLVTKLKLRVIELEAALIPFASVELDKELGDGWCYVGRREPGVLNVPHLHTKDFELAKEVLEG